jgi:hypothetical protein
LAAIDIAEKVTTLIWRTKILALAGFAGPGGLAQPVQSKWRGV